MGDEIREFLGVLGVEVVEVEPDGRCATWVPVAREVRVCRELCPGGARGALSDLLASGRLDFARDV